MIPESVSSALLSTVLILVLGALFKNVIREWLVTRIRSGIQHDFDKELESHKAQLALQTQDANLRLSNDLQMHKAFLDTVRSSFSEGQRSSMERKLVAIDKIWEEVLELRKLTLPTMSIVDVFQKTEARKFRALKESDFGLIFCKQQIQSTSIRKGFKLFLQIWKEFVPLLANICGTY